MFMPIALSELGGISAGANGSPCRKAFRGRSVQVSNVYRMEVRLTVAAIIVTIISTSFFISDLSLVCLAAFRHDRGIDIAVAGMLAAIMLAFLYTNVAYLLSRIGSVIRHAEHVPDQTNDLLSIYDKDAPSLTVLVPSYNEDELVVSRALLSAALAEYPSKKVVLLIDDAPYPENDSDARALAHMRQLPRKLQILLAPISHEFREELSECLRRLESGP